MRTAAQADNTAEGVAEEEEASEAGEVGHGRSNSAANFDHGPCYRDGIYPPTREDRQQCPRRFHG